MKRILVMFFISSVVSLGACSTSDEGRRVYLKSKPGDDLKVPEDLAVPIQNKGYEIPVITVEGATVDSFISEPPLLDGVAPMPEE